MGLCRQGGQCDELEVGTLIDFQINLSKYNFENTFTAASCCFAERAGPKSKVLTVLQIAAKLFTLLADEYFLAIRMASDDNRKRAHFHYQLYP